MFAFLHTSYLAVQCLSNLKYGRLSPSLFT
jgi:hypothetical protein